MSSNSVKRQKNKIYFGKMAVLL